MPSAEELLEQLRSLGETERLEAKLAGSISHSIMETVCAFSNEPGLGGGYLLLGVAEDKDRLIPTYPVEGITNVDKITNDLLSQCNDLFNFALRPDILPELVEGRVILKVFVPEVSASAKPVYFKSDGLPRGVFRRLASGDVQCNEDDLAIFYEGRGEETFDARVLKRAEWSDIDPDAIEDYRRERAKASPDAQELLWSDEELLYSLDCVRKEAGQYQPTCAGLLLFGTKQSLRRLFPMMRVDYVRVPGREWVPNPDKRFDSIDMRDPLMRVVRRSLSAILDDFSQPFSLPEGQAQRDVTQPLPPRALREALVNAVMHRSYRQESPVLIIRYANRLEIRNPGYSLKSEERWGEPRSLNRNPKIAAVLHETRFAETKGSGMRVMREEMEKVGLSPPFFESDRIGDQFIVTFSTHHFLNAQDWRWLSAFREFNLSEEEARALIWVRESGDAKGAISNAVYRNLNGGEAREALKQLRRLCDLQILIAKGRGSAAHYVPGPEFLKRTDHGEASEYLPNTSPKSLEGKGALLSHLPTSTHKEIDSSHSDSPSTHSDSPSTHTDENPQHSGLTSPHKIKDLAPYEARVLLLSELTEPLRSYVEEMGPRADPSMLRRILMELGAVRSWTAKELSLLLRRNLNQLVARHLTPMVNKGFLEHTIPEVRSHPQQAYRAASGDEK